MFDKEKSFAKIGKCLNQLCYICSNFTLESTLPPNELAMELQRIPMRIICQEAGLTENQKSDVLKMNENVAKDYIIDWEKFKLTLKAYSSKPVAPPMPVNKATTESTMIFSQFRPSIPAYPSNQIQVPNQIYWLKFLIFLSQQILMQSYLVSPSIIKPTPPVLIPYSSQSQFFNETYANASISQPHQQYIFVGGTNNNDYDFLYSQMQQKIQQITQTIFTNKCEPQFSLSSRNNTNNNHEENNNEGTYSNFTQQAVLQSYANVAKDPGCIKDDICGFEKCSESDEN